LPLARSLGAYLSGSVPATDTPTAWTDPVFAAEQAMRLWRPNESSVVDPRNLSGESGVGVEESPVPPPEVCIEQAHRMTYDQRVAEFRKDHSGRNPPVQTTKDGLEGDREWAVRNGISRDEIARLREECLKTTLGRPPKNSTENSAKK